MYTEWVRSKLIFVVLRMIIWMRLHSWLTQYVQEDLFKVNDEDLIKIGQDFMDTRFRRSFPFCEARVADLETRVEAIQEFNISLSFNSVAALLN